MQLGSVDCDSMCRRAMLTSISTQVIWTIKEVLYRVQPLQVDHRELLSFTEPQAVNVCMALHPKQNRLPFPSGSLLPNRLQLLGFSVSSVVVSVLIISSPTATIICSCCVRRHGRRSPSVSAVAMLLASMLSCTHLQN